jgi:type IV pilus assembly protein PilE
MRNMNRGFTLLEVLTVAVVIGVLTAIAVPSWQTHVLRTRRGEATAALLDLQRAQDRYFGTHARYAPAAQLDSAPPDGLGMHELTPLGAYRLELNTAADGLGFLATATVVPSSGQAGDERCARFTIDHLGQRRATDASGIERSADCWR